MDNTREKLIELLNAIDGVCPKDASCYDCEYKDVTHCAIPAKADFLIANDVVPVVRCKDCWKSGEGLCSYQLKNVPGKDFCGDGERIEGE